MIRIKELLRNHSHIIVLGMIIFVLITIPILDIYLVLGDAWQGISPSFSDETLYQGRIQNIVKGHFAGGNPYFLEHRNDPPLVVFGGIWINALPQLLGLSLNVSLLINFILWSFLFILALYWLFSTLWVSPWMSVLGTVFIYVQSYQHIIRPANLQTVYPFFFLIYLTLFRFLREQNRKNSLLLAVVFGATFYLYSYLWQTIAVTFGILLLYALVRKNWPLLRETVFALLVGGVIGFPLFVYTFWLSHISPHFWESVLRLGLVNTHLPMAEVIYSGGWIGVVLALFVFIYWRVKTLREDREFLLLSLFLIISGLGLWFTQGSNLITGKLLETGEHLFLLIQPWLVFSTVSTSVLLWKRRMQLGKDSQALSVIIVILLIGVSIYYAYPRFSRFIPNNVDSSLWHIQQLYAKPFSWLDQREKDSVVVWSNPHNYLATILPTLTKHFSLYTPAAIFELLSEAELRERYLVSEYFDNPKLSDLQSQIEMQLYLGRHDLFHEPKTIERGIKICRLLFFWDKKKECGTVPTVTSLLGDEFFVGLENKFKKDIKLNIKTYLFKYHVSYIFKDKLLDQKYNPEELGAIRVYEDDRYEIYQF